MSPSTAKSHDEGFLAWSVRVLSTTRMLRATCAIIILLCCVPVLVHYYLTLYDVSGNDFLRNDDKLNELIYNGEGNQAIESLVFRVNELKAIKISVSNELRDLEKRRQTMLYDLSTFTRKVEVQRHLSEKGEKYLNELRINSDSAKILAVERATVHYDDTQWRNLVVKLMSLPRPANQTTDNKSSRSSSPSRCTMSSCFDYTRCHLQSQFPVYFYSPDEFVSRSSAFTIAAEVKRSLIEAFGRSPHMAYDAGLACVYVAVVNGSRARVLPYLRALPYWTGGGGASGGQNHVVLQLDGRAPPLVDIDSAIVVAADHGMGGAPYYDVIAPPPSLVAGGAEQQPRGHPLPLLVPVRRHYLLSFHGRGGGAGAEDLMRVLSQMEATFSPGRGQSGGFKFVFRCDNDTTASPVAGDDEADWSICDDDHYVEDNSTFSLLFGSDTQTSSTQFQTRLYRALERGAIPVILSPRVDALTLLPFSPLIDWSQSVLVFAPQRVSELHIVLMSLKDADLMAMKLAGRHLFQTYLMDTRQMVTSLLATLRTRLSIPAIPVRDTTAMSVFNSTFTPLVDTEFIPLDSMETDENLGPTEKPLDSPSFDHNFTTHLKKDKYISGDPFSLYASTPFDTDIVGDAQFIGSSFGFRPIGGGTGGSGREFSESLGGDRIREQFTVVILTYERTQVLLSAVGRLKSLPYLHSVVVVWNSPEPPASDIKWPDIGVKVHIIRPPGGRNSLNNRFIPYDVIRTEAVLSLDDDAHLRHDEIIFGFRIWREARDRIVGFPGRFHTFDVKHTSFLYDSNYTCQLSMVLTGAAFIHKYYYHQYTNVQPAAIREMVDKFTNCEDLAMNFLVSHITGKPPIKITSRWTFRCAGCPQTLSSDAGHFSERHRCMNLLRAAYGYLPLRHTQFRADSVLFKTRIPHDKQKCFKYV